MATNYHTIDLASLAADFAQWGITDWSVYQTAATAQIDREITVSWYRGMAANNNVDWRATAFDRDLLLAPTQFERAAGYLVLALAAEAISRGQDDFSARAEKLRKMYQTEISYVLTSGLDYDWVTNVTDSGELAGLPLSRRLHRC